MEKRNVINRVEVMTSEVLVDPRDGYPKTAFYFNKFEGNKGYDCQDEVRYPEPTYPDPEKDEEGNDLPVEPIYDDPYYEYVCTEVMTIDENMIVSVINF